MDKKALLFDIQKFCIHDGPGIRTNIFFKGCSLRCKWCANPESQMFTKDMFVNKAKCTKCLKCIQRCENQAIEFDNMTLKNNNKKCKNCGKCVEKCPSKARKIYGREYTLEEIIEEAEKDKIFYIESGGGVTFSGGEPALFPEVVREIAKYFNDEKISTTIETCGYAPFENYKEFLEYIDLFYFDVKIWDSEKHKRYCGVANEIILDNLNKLSKIKEVVVRMPIIPTINDSEIELREIGEHLQSLGSIEEIHILAYHNMATGKYEGLGREYQLANIKPPEQEKMNHVKEIMEEYVVKVKIGG